MHLPKSLLVNCTALALLVSCLTSSPAQEAAKKGSLRLLSIGVEPGLSAQGKNDPYAGDAQHVADAFAAAKPFFRSYDPEVINGSNATRQNVINGLTALIRSQQADDLAVIFFSTHGSWNANTGYAISLAKEGKQHATISDREFLGILSQAKGPVMVFLDTCCAAGVLPPNDRVVPRVSFLVACRRDEGSSGSGPSKRKPHGCFVVALVEALQGRADADSNGQVTLAEVQTFLPGRAKEMYNEQNAVARIRQPHAQLALAAVDPKKKPAQIEAEAEAATRNPFGMADVERPLGKDVIEFARDVRIPGGMKDENAAPWSELKVPKQDTIEGRWSARWKDTAGWATGSAIVKIKDDRVYIMYHDEGSRYLIETRRNGQRLVGRYVNISDENDTAPWVGRIIDHDRIDGMWPGGRWDLRRTWEE